MRDYISIVEGLWNPKIYSNDATRLPTDSSNKFGAHDAIIIWGIGDDPTAAQHDAIRWIHMSGETRVEEIARKAVMLRVAFMTNRLLQAIKEVGSAKVAFVRKGNMLDIKPAILKQVG